MPDLPRPNRTALEFITFVAEPESISRSDKAKRLEVRDQECVNLGIAHERRRLRELSLPEFAVVQTALSTGQHSAAKDAARPALERIAKLFEVPERQSVPFVDASPMRTDESKISRELAEQMLPPIDAVVRQPFKQLLLSELEYEDLGQVLQFALFHSTPNSKLAGHARRLKQALENGAVSDARTREQTAPPMVEVLFVLNGENATVQVNPGDSVGKARDLALAKSDWSRAPQDWEMRDAGGHTVSPLIDARECPPLVYLSLRECLGQVLPADALTFQQLISILSNHCGESFNGEPGTSEGAVETLTRIIRQRDELRPDPTAARVYIRCDDVALLLASSVYPIGNPRLEDATKRIRMALARPGTPSAASKPASSCAATCSTRSQPRSSRSPLVEEAEQLKPAYPRRPRHRVTDLREAVSAALRPGGAFAKPISPHKEEAPEHHILRLGLRLLLALAARLDRLDSDKAPDVEDEQWAAQRGSGVVKGE